MSQATAYPHPVYDLFSSSSRSSQIDINESVEKEARRWEHLASEQKRLEKIDAIVTLPQQYREKNWDGLEAAPIPESAFQEARTFLRKLPPSVPMPEVIAEPDGYLGLEWYINKWLLYVVSFNGSGVLSCSGLIGSERIYGPRYMDEGIPAEILRNIARVLQ
ncbi:MAG: hypothetical protein E4G89_02520 [Methanothrix sp.]|nr:MAG: hypothetical protein E4G89_02520 [Methanothrix sp.]